MNRSTFRGPSVEERLSSVHVSHGQRFIFSRSSRWRALFSQGLTYFLRCEVGPLQFSRRDTKHSTREERRKPNDETFDIADLLGLGLSSASSSLPPPILFLLLHSSSLLHRLLFLLLLHSSTPPHRPPLRPPPPLRPSLPPEPRATTGIIIHSILRKYNVKTTPSKMANDVT